MSNDFVCGDEVRWASQAQGTWKRKQGTVVAVVPAGMCPSDFQAVLVTGRVPSGGFGQPRNHESYLVKVGNKLYWPRTSQLWRSAGSMDGA